jgi:hypothetical protein
MYFRLPFQDVWQMFGEGVHPNFPSLFKKELAPFLSQGASKFWSKKRRYFKNGLYYHGKSKLLYTIVSICHYLLFISVLPDQLESLGVFWTSVTGGMGRLIRAVRALARITRQV